MLQRTGRCLSSRRRRPSKFFFLFLFFLESRDHVCWSWWKWVHPVFMPPSIQLNYFHANKLCRLISRRIACIPACPLKEKFKKSYEPEQEGAKEKGFLWGEFWLDFAGASGIRFNVMHFLTTTCAFLCSRAGPLWTYQAQTKTNVMLVEWVAILALKVELGWCLELMRSSSRWYSGYPTAGGCICWPGVWSAS